MRRAVRCWVWVDGSICVCVIRQTLRATQQRVGLEDSSRHSKSDDRQRRGARRGSGRPSRYMWTPTSYARQCSLLSHPCSVNLGIETAGGDVHLVQLEGVSAMTKA